MVKWPRAEQLPKWIVDRAVLYYNTYFERSQTASGVWQDNVGFVKGYNVNSMHLYYWLMKQRNLQGARKIHTTHPGTFGYWMPWSEKNYDQYKQKMLAQESSQDMEKDIFDKKELIYKLHYQTGALDKELAPIFGYSVANIRKIAYNYRELKVTES